jgi:hypothetical protein
MDMLEHKQLETDKKLDAVLDKIEELSPAVTTEQLFQSGCVWDAQQKSILAITSKRNWILINTTNNMSLSVMYNCHMRYMTVT